MYVYTHRPKQQLLYSYFIINTHLYMKNLLLVQLHAVQ